MKRVTRSKASRSKKAKKSADGDTTRGQPLPHQDAAVQAGGSNQDVSVQAGDSNQDAAVQAGGGNGAKDWSVPQNGDSLPPLEQGQGGVPLTRAPRNLSEGQTKLTEGSVRRGPLYHRVSVGPDPTKSNTSNHDTEQINIDLSMGKSPIKTDVLCYYLDSYPNKSDAAILKDGFINGFSIGFTGNFSGSLSQNLKSARLNPTLLKEKISKEVALGRVAGPFTSPPFPIMKISPVGLVEKTDGGYRLITHLSHPEGNSVNDGISNEASSVTYTSFDTVADMIFKLGSGSKMAKRDIKSAFRLLPISPADFWLLGFRDEDGNYYVDKFLPMGCKISSALFEKFASFLHWLTTFLAGSESMDHYLDDFFFGGPAQSESCSHLVNVFSRVCCELAVPLADEKSVDPCTKLIFLGLELDSVLLVIRIPFGKLVELRAILEHTLARKKLRLREFQSLVGKLSFFSKAIRSSRAFLRRFYDAMVNIHKPYHRIRITGEIRKDLLVWLSFLDQFNGITHIPESMWFDNDYLQLFTDSAGSWHLGCGCFFRNEWCFFQWPEHWRKDVILGDLTFLEMVPVLLALYLWAERIKYTKIVFYIDNEALVSVLNKNSSKSKRVMQLVRNFVLITMKHEIVFKAVHIPSECNSVADAISRKQWVRFRNLVPEADEEPRAVPESFLSTIFNLNLSVC